MVIMNMNTKKAKQRTRLHSSKQSRKPKTNKRRVMTGKRGKYTTRKWTMTGGKAPEVMKLVEVEKPLSFAEQRKMHNSGVGKAFGRGPNLAEIAEFRKKIPPKSPNAFTEKNPINDVNPRGINFGNELSKESSTNNELVIMREGNALRRRVNTEGNPIGTASIPPPPPLPNLFAPPPAPPIPTSLPASALPPPSNKSEKSAQLNKFRRTVLNTVTLSGVIKGLKSVPKTNTRQITIAPNPFSSSPMMKKVNAMRNANTAGTESEKSPFNNNPSVIVTNKTINEKYSEVNPSNTKQSTRFMSTNIPVQGPVNQYQTKKGKVVTNVANAITRRRRALSFSDKQEEEEWDV